MDINLSCRNFVLHVENAFRNRGLRVDVLVLGPRTPLGAAVHRQYVEGVLAVVRLSRPNQFSRKIPLQIFDRSAGPDSVRFSGAFLTFHSLVLQTLITNTDIETQTIQRLIRTSRRR